MNDLKPHEGLCYHSPDKCWQNKQWVELTASRVFTSMRLRRRWQGASVLPPQHVQEPTIVLCCGRFHTARQRKLLNDLTMNSRWHIICSCCISLFVVGSQLASDIAGNSSSLNPSQKKKHLLNQDAIFVSVCLSDSEKTSRKLNFKNDEEMKFK